MLVARVGIVLASSQEMVDRVSCRASRRVMQPAMGRSRKTDRFCVAVSADGQDGLLIVVSGFGDERDVAEVGFG